METQGKKANKAGGMFEEIVATILKENKIKFIPQHILCKSIYGHPHKVDFFITNVLQYQNGLVIQAKWQDRSGSVDEKYPYEVMNIREMYPCPAIFIVAGGGQKDGAIIWMKKQVDDKLIAVMNITEFVSSMNRGLLLPGEKP
jgi:hypothetical protein